MIEMYFGDCIFGVNVVTECISRAPCREVSLPDLGHAVRPAEAGGGRSRAASAQGGVQLLHTL